MQRKLERLRRKFGGGARVLAPIMAFVILATALYTMVFNINLITVKDTKGGSKTLLTTSKEDKANEIIELAGIETQKADAVVYTEKSNAAADITIHRAFPVSVEVDGQTLETEIAKGDVGDMLESCGVKLGVEDIVQPQAETKVKEDMNIKVLRVTYKEETKRDEVEEAAVQAFLSEKPEEQESFKKSNRDVYNVTYKHRLVDGEIESSEILNLEGLIVPREPGSTTFEPGVPCSRIEGYDDVAVDENGVPTNAKRVMNGAVTTAYSSSRGKGSSGLGLYNGTVAVNPNVIPYGTRMYITSSDNKFVYGYAIATDTGGAMMDGRVDIDLFFETNAECLRFGKRKLDVYILD